MKLFKNFYKTVTLLGIFVIIGTGCEVFDIEDKPDPNNIALDGVVNNPTEADIAQLVAGTLSAIREPVEQYFVDVGMVGREMYRFLQAEPRFTQDLMGGGNAVLDAGSFYITNPWAEFYTNIRMTNIIIEAVSGDIEGLTQESANGASGFAKTIKAYQYLLALNLTNENGVVQQNQADISEVGQLLTKSESFDLINRLLDEAATELNNAGDSFGFALPAGFEGFNDPAGFREFNRGLRARVAAYVEDWPAVNSALQESFIDANGSLETGVFHDFTNDPNDISNPIFADPQSGRGDSWVAHPDWVPDAESDDQRVDDKVVERNSIARLDGLESDFGLFVYKTITSPIPIMRNAELLLLRAEYNINKSSPDLDAAQDDINVIRNTAGLPDFGGQETQQALLDEVLNQRRYELFLEGHRWVDMRRYNRLDELPKDRNGDNVWPSFPIPENENL